MSESRYKIIAAHPAEFSQMLRVWEASVRATHHFLQEKDIVAIRPLVTQGFQQMEHLLCVKDELGTLHGFMGIAAKKIEMLFLSPQSCGKGLGKRCVACAARDYGARYVDVNEQNEMAAGFYRHSGFQEIGRSEQDPMGNPFPILHMELSETLAP